MALDTYSDKTVLLLHFDDAIGATTLTDAMGYVTQQTGSGTVVADATAFGGKCLDVSGSATKTFTHPLLYLGYDDYTVELRIKKTGTLPSNPTIIWNKCPWSSGVDTGYFDVTIDHSSHPGLALWWDGQVRVRSGTSLLTDNNWHTVAISRFGGTTRLFYDGVVVASTTYVGIVNLIDLHLGYESTYPLGFMVDELRVTRGVARYTDNYTPATAPFAEDPVTPWWSTTDLDWPNVVLSVPFESSLTAEAKGKTLSTVGSPALSSTFTPFGTHAIQCGANSYVLLPSNSGITIGASSWTYNVWMQPTATDLDTVIHETLCVRENDSYFQIGLYAGQLMLWNGSTWVTPTRLRAGQAAYVEVSVDDTGYLRMFVNGCLLYAEATGYTTWWPNAARASLGGDYAGHGQHWYGKLKDLRLTRGVVRHTASFFPPLVPHPGSIPAISGWTKLNGVGISTTVRCHLRSNGALIAETTSASDGAFTISAYSDEDHYLVALSPSGGNALIFDKVRGS